MLARTCTVAALHRHDGKRVQMLDVLFGASRLELFADTWHTIIAEVSVRSRHLGAWMTRPRSEEKCQRGSLGSRRKAFGRLRDFVPLPVEELGERHQHDSNVDGREQGPLPKRLCVWQCGDSKSQANTTAWRWRACTERSSACCAVSGKPYLVLADTSP
jgi:hypothetical protein